MEALSQPKNTLGLVLGHTNQAQPPHQSQRAGESPPLNQSRKKNPLTRKTSTFHLYNTTTNNHHLRITNLFFSFAFCQVLWSLLLASLYTLFTTVHLFTLQFCLDSQSPFSTDFLDTNTNNYPRD